MNIMLLFVEPPSTTSTLEDILFLLLLAVACYAVWKAKKSAKEDENETKF